MPNECFNDFYIFLELELLYFGKKIEKDPPTFVSWDEKIAEITKCLCNFNTDLNSNETLQYV